MAEMDRFSAMVVSGQFAVAHLSRELVCGWIASSGWRGAWLSWRPVGERLKRRARGVESEAQGGPHVTHFL